MLTCSSKHRCVQNLIDLLAWLLNLTRKIYSSVFGFSQLWISINIHSASLPCYSEAGSQRLAPPLGPQPPISHQVLKMVYLQTTPGSGEVKAINYWKRERLHMHYRCWWFTAEILYRLLLFFVKLAADKVHHMWKMLHKFGTETKPLIMDCFDKIAQKSGGQSIIIRIRRVIFEEIRRSSGTLGGEIGLIDGRQPKKCE